MSSPLLEYPPCANFHRHRHHHPHLQNVTDLQYRLNQVKPLYEPEQNLFV